jgi:phage nucleotide-binding protein
MSEEVTKPKITLGGIEVQSGATQSTRLSALIWGAAGCGKTTLAGTAPGKKLWINFDPDGTSSLLGRSDIVILDLSALRPDAVNSKFRTDEALGLSKFIQEHNIDTVVVDSLTAYSQIAMDSYVGKEGKSTIEKPGISAYGARNSLTLRLIQAVLRETGRNNTHVIFITHEDAPVTNDDGLVLYITMQLGGKLPDQAALQISEVWYMSDDGKKRKLAVRPCRSRKPMKSRMFDTTVDLEFDWKYDINKPDPKYELATWYNDWKAHGKKIQVPK